VTGVEHSADDALTFTKIIPCLQQKHQDECHDKLISYVTDNWDQKFKGLDLDLIISAIRFAKECKSGSIATRIINWSKESPTKTQAIMEACGGLPEAGTHHSLVRLLAGVAQLDAPTFAKVTVLAPEGGEYIPSAMIMSLCALAHPWGIQERSDSEDVWKEVLRTIAKE
jgi:hypothetical protein